LAGSNATLSRGLTDLSSSQTRGLNGSNSTQSRGLTGMTTQAIRPQSSTDGRYVDLRHRAIVKSVADAIRCGEYDTVDRRSESYERIGERRNPPHGSAVNNDYSPMATLRSVATGYSSTEEYSSTARQSSTSGRGERAQNIRDDYDRERASSDVGSRRVYEPDYGSKASPIHTAVSSRGGRPSNLLDPYTHIRSTEVFEKSSERSKSISLAEEKRKLEAEIAFHQKRLKAIQEEERLESNHDKSRDSGPSYSRHYITSQQNSASAVHDQSRHQEPLVSSSYGYGHDEYLQWGTSSTSSTTHSQSQAAYPAEQSATAYHAAQSTTAYHATKAPTAYLPSQSTTAFQQQRDVQYGNTSNSYQHQYAQQSDVVYQQQQQQYLHQQQQLQQPAYQWTYGTRPSLNRT